MSGARLIYLYKTRFNLHTSRSYGYSQINTKAYINVPANQNVNRGFLCIIGVQGVLSYEYNRGIYNLFTFINFMNEKVITYYNSNFVEI